MNLQQSRAKITGHDPSVHGMQGPATCRDRDEGTTQGTLAVLREEEGLQIGRGSFWEEEQAPD